MQVRLSLLMLAMYLCIVGVSAQATSIPLDNDLPTLQQVYVSLTGNDSNDGATPQSALRTITEAWNRIPTADMTTGYHILIGAGTYAPEDTPNYWEQRYGTSQFPIILEALDGKNTAYLPSVNLFDVQYVSFINLNFEVENDAFHCEQCVNLLLRGNVFKGAEPDTYNTQETVKVNQSQYVYLEDNDISGAWDNAIDFVAVQYGHWIGNRVHNAGDWCAYLKGGSAYFEVRNNEFYDCGTGGFTAGQGTGFQFMVEPWTQYEAYDIKFINNLVHHTSGAGVGVKGGYDILVAYNLFYQVGERSHVMEFGFGERSCDGQPSDSGRENCETYRQNGGWGNSVGADGTNYVRIPSKNVFVYNNILLNVAPYQSGYQQFAIPAPFSEATNADSGVPMPTLADDNLQIVGNIIWNGDVNMPLGIEEGQGCEASNPTCNREQLIAQNGINTTLPQVINANGGDYTVQVSFIWVSIPDFPTWDVPAPMGSLANAVNAVFKSDGTARP